MTGTSTMWRLLVLSLCLLGAAALGDRAMRPELTPLREPLHAMPLTVAEWAGQDAAPFAPNVLAQLGVDEYLNRVYVAGDYPLSLYIGYYQSQRAGDTIHSPQN